MSRTWFVVIMALALVGAGCGYGPNYMNGAGFPHITQLTPASIAHWSIGLPLMVVGTGFGQDSVVYWEAMPQPTIYVNSGQLTAEIPAANLLNVDTVRVYVRSGGVNSNAWCSRLIDVVGVGMSFEIQRISILPRACLWFVSEIGISPAREKNIIYKIVTLTSRPVRQLRMRLSFKSGDA
jgi:hypothetical protein